MEEQLQLIDIERENKVYDKCNAYLCFYCTGIILNSFTNYKPECNLILWQQ